jgi:hypothetical protein
MVVDAVVVFFGALAGAVIGVYGGLTVERLRGRRELEHRRREDIKAGLVALNEHAAAALRICADLEAAGHWPGLQDDDWRTLRAKQLPAQAADMLTALARVDVFLPDASIIERRVSDYFDVLIAPDDQRDRAGRGRLARAAAAHAQLRNAIREELQRDADVPGWYGTARRVVSPREWRAGLASFGMLRPKDGE